VDIAAGNEAGVDIGFDHGIYFKVPVLVIFVPSTDYNNLSFWQIIWRSGKVLPGMGRNGFSFGCHNRMASANKQADSSDERYPHKIRITGPRLLTLRFNVKANAHENLRQLLTAAGYYRIFFPCV